MSEGPRRDQPKVKRSLTNIQLSSVHAWKIWVILAIATLAVHGLTIRLSPVIWKDEVQILDFGRVALSGWNSEWGINWLREGRPYFTISYLGPVIQELGLRVASGDMVGSRLSSLFGAAFASAAMLTWLLARGILPLVALLAALIFLLDPMISQSHRGGRVDVLAMGLMFFAFASLHWQAPPLETRKFDRGAALAGALVGLAALSWPSAGLLIPLLAHELATRPDSSRRTPWQRHLAALPGAMHVFVFASAMLAAFLLPIALAAPASFGDIEAWGRTIAVTGGSRFDLAFWLSSLAVFAKSFQYSPWVLLVAAAMLLYQRGVGIASVTVVAVIGILLTRAYFYRVIYVLPYVFLALAVGAAHLLLEREKWKRRLSLVGLLVLLAWSAGITLGARTGVAWMEREVRDPALVMAMAEDAIGEGEYRVYLGSWSLYYAGRQLGWRMFRNFDGLDETDSLEWHGLLRTMDYAVYDARSVPRFLDAKLKGMGFTRKVISSAKYGRDKLEPVRDAGKAYVTNWLVYESARRENKDRPAPNR